jgi:hypothetical protein
VLLSVEALWLRVTVINKTRYERVLQRILVNERREGSAERCKGALDLLVLTITHKKYRSRWNLVHYLTEKMEQTDVR